MIDHLRHMTKVRPPGLDRDAAMWALDEIEQLRSQRDEWKAKWLDMARAAILAGGGSVGPSRDQAT